MTTEQKGNNPILETTVPKEKLTSPIFQVRFGCGPHSLVLSNWHESLIKDVNSFFQPNSRNIFYMEDADGSQTFQDKVRGAYKVYGKYTTAWDYADLHLQSSDGYPSASFIKNKSDELLNQQGPNLADGVRFVRKVLAGLDEIVEKKGILIDFVLETRKNPQDRATVENATQRMENLGKNYSLDEFRQWVFTTWSMVRLRDKKIMSDLIDIYKKAFKDKQQTRVYVSLGTMHVPSGLIVSTFGKRPSCETTVIRDGMSDFEQDMLFLQKSIAMLDAGMPISAQKWQNIYEESKKK